MVSPVSVWITNGPLLSWRTVKRLMMTFVNPRFVFGNGNDSWNTNRRLKVAYWWVKLLMSWFSGMDYGGSFWCLRRSGVMDHDQISCMLLSLSHDLTGKSRVKRSWENFVFRRTYRFRESDKDESKVAQRWCCATLLFEIVWWASITCGYLYYGLGDYSRNIVWCMYDNDKQYASLTYM